MREPLLHFSSRPLTSVYSVRQSTEADMKPYGLWVSNGHGEDSWPHWCRAEGFALDRFACATEVVLGKEANVLRLEGADALDAFDQEFGETQMGRHTLISWKRVAQRYQGILIAPYVWSRRHSSCFWYYTWDCASGCVWDASAIAELRSVPGLDLRMMKECADA